MDSKALVYFLRIKSLCMEQKADRGWHNIDKSGQYLLSCLQCICNYDKTV